jgi:hypothetical protein
MTAAARRTVVLSWLLPAGVLAVGLLWLLPLAVRGAAARVLVDDAIGNWVVLGIWLVWATSLAAVASTLERGGRSVGTPWAVVQVALLIAVAVWALPPVLLAAPGSAEQVTTALVHLLLPVLVLALSAAQGLLLFLRA